MNLDFTSIYPPEVPILVDPDRLGGIPCFHGTCVPIENLLNNLESGLSVEEYIDCFPDVTMEQVAAVLKYAHDRIMQPAA